MIIEELMDSMMKAGFTADQIRRAVHCFDDVLVNYTITKNEANVVVYDTVNINQRYMELYLQCRKFEGMTNGTLYNQKLYLQKLIETLPCSVTEASSMHIRRYLSWYQEQGWTNASVEKVKSAVSSFYKWLIKERQTSFNPTDSIPKLKSIFKFQGALDAEELKYIKFACKNDRESLLVEFLASSGCRIREFVDIQLKDIDLNERKVVVTGKGNKQRPVYFSPEAKIFIIKLYGEDMNIEGFLFQDIRDGSKVETATARNILKDIFSRVKDHIKLKKVTPHTMRRTFATTMLAKGVPLEIVSKLLGHSQLQTTTRYITIADKTLQMEHQKFIA